MNETNEPGLGFAPVAAKSEAYRVLARKYRPQDFTGLIGQEALVRTLRNAFATARIAHAFMLTGVRGVGKTTTARIIARALNCVGPDGTRKEPTIQPCGVCDPCVAIAESRHLDVQEMDGASNNGVDEVRQIIDSVRYAPASARYKVYIIDEVHMLSKQAFNALLKTLEEPPAHVEFIFATTEIRKVPVTILSRCQRFDLRRIGTEELIAHLGKIAAQEKVEVEPAALALIARAAEGSVRDALSLLDQAIAHEDGATIAAESVRAMLGLADRSRILDLFEKIMRGEIGAGLAELADIYEGGADPLVVMQDLLEITHFLTRLKVAPAAEGFFDGGSGEARRAAAMAAALPLSGLTRAWQMLLKGLFEVRDAVRPVAAAEMALIRLAYATDLPPTDKLVREVLERAGSRGGPSGPRQPNAIARGRHSGQRGGERSSASSRRERFVAARRGGGNREPAHARRPCSARGCERCFGAQGADRKSRAPCASRARANRVPAGRGCAAESCWRSGAEAEGMDRRALGGHRGARRRRAHPRGTEECTARSAARTGGAGATGARGARPLSGCRNCRGPRPCTHSSVY